jgi:hypothetical protein
MNKEVELYDFLDIINCDLVLRRYANKEGRWMANIPNSDILESGILNGAYGDGTTPEEAIYDYISEIKGGLLVIHAGKPELRKEYAVPTNIKRW